MQQRSRERLETILSVAITLVSRGGVEALKMGDIAKRARISIGSLYQYFPDKGAVIRALAQRYNDVGRACVREDLQDVHTRRDLREALCRIVDAYYAMFLAEPVMRDIWAGAQADRLLQDIDEEDCRAHAQLIDTAAARVVETIPARQRQLESTLLSQLINAVVRQAITLPRAQGDALIQAFKSKIITAYW